MQTQDPTNDIEFPDDPLTEYPGDEGREEYRGGFLRRLLPIVAFLVLAAFLAWTLRSTGLLIPRLTADADGRPLTLAGESIPRLPERVLRDGAWQVTYEFWFDDAIRTVVVRIPQEDYAISESRPDGMVVDSSESRDAWTRRYYTRQLEWPEQERAVETALAQLRPIRDALGLSSDDYVRLLNAFVGTIPYDSVTAEAVRPKRYPCSLLTEGVGVCEDKSMLLGAMLAAEGYDVALLLLESDNHMAVGVRSDTKSYKGTGYAFIDVVGVYVREPDHEYQEPVDVGKPSEKYVSKPLVVPLTRGGTRFGVD